MRFVLALFLFLIHFRLFAEEQNKLKQIINFNFDKNSWNIVFNEKIFNGMPILFNKKNERLRGFINQELRGVFSGELSSKSAAECEKIKKHYSLSSDKSHFKFESYTLNNTCTINISKDQEHKFQILFFTSNSYKNKNYLVANTITFSFNNENFLKNMTEIFHLKENILKSQGSYL